MGRLCAMVSVNSLVSMNLMVSMLLMMSLLFSSTAWANDEPRTYDRINLSSSANTQVQNDTLVAVLYYQREGIKLSALANEVNEKISQAVRTSKQVPNIEVQTVGYQTSPVYEKRRLSGWRVRQAVRLESRDTEQMGKLLGELQATLALESINYQVSPDKLREVEDKLISRAIGAFKQRAMLITQELGRSNYRLVEMNVNTAGAPVRPVRMFTAAMAKESAVVPPAIEAGKQDVQVSVSGTIELLLE
jgi:predicted secreted protein